MRKNNRAKKGLNRESDTKPPGVPFNPNILQSIVLAILDALGTPHTSNCESLDVPTYDVFVSHSSTENAFVDALAKDLSRLGLKVCYDTLSFNYGDPLQAAMVGGLSDARICLAVLSPSYFNSYWCRSELEAILQLERYTDRRVLVPIWFDVDYEDVMMFSPIVASRKAMSSAIMAVSEMAIELSHLLTPV